MAVPSTIKEEGGSAFSNLFKGLFDTGATFLRENLFGGEGASQQDAIREQQAKIMAAKAAQEVAPKSNTIFGLSPTVLAIGAVAVVGIGAFALSR